MKKYLKVILILLITLVYLLGKVQRIHRHSETVARLLKNKQIQTELKYENTNDNKMVITEIKDNKKIKNKR